MGQAKMRGTLEDRQAQAKGLLDLATARTGREINMDMVQILDAVAFGHITKAMTEAVTMYTAKNKKFDQASFPLIADAQDDGRLVIRVTIKDKIPKIIEVPAGKWRELTNQQFKDIEKNLESEQKAHPEDLMNLIEDMGKHIVSSKEEYLRQESIAKAAADRATEMLLIFDRSPESLEAAKRTTEIKKSLTDDIDSWLSTNNDYIVIHWPQGKPLTSMMAINMEALLESTLPTIANHSVSVQTCLLRSSESNQYEAVRNRWKDLGGLVADY